MYRHRCNLSFKKESGLYLRTRDYTTYTHNYVLNHRRGIKTMTGFVSDAEGELPLINSGSEAVKELYENYDVIISRNSYDLHLDNFDYAIKIFKNMFV